MRVGYRWLLLIVAVLLLVHRASVAGALSQSGSPEEWQLVRGGFSDVVDISSFGGDVIWAVSSRDILEFDGLNWRVSVPEVYPTSISMATDGTGWIGTIVGPWYFDGSKWHSHVSSPARYIVDVSAVRNGMAWAIVVANPGLPDNAHLVKFDQGGNEAARFAVEGQYQALSAAADHDIWLVGASGIAHFDGAEFERYPLMVPDTLVDVSFASSERGWAVGGACVRGEEGSRVVATFVDGRWAVTDRSSQAPLQRVATLPSGGAVAGDYRARVYTLESGVPELAVELPGSGARCSGGITAIASSTESDSILIGGLQGGTGGDPFVFSYSNEGLTQLHGFVFSRMAMITETSGWALAENLVEITGGRWLSREGHVGVPEVVRDLQHSGQGTLLAAGREQSEAVLAKWSDGRWYTYALNETGSANRVVKDESGTTWVGGNRTIDDLGEAFVVASGENQSDWVEEWSKLNDPFVDMAVGHGGHAVVLTASGNTYERTAAGWSAIPDLCGVPFTALAATEFGGWAVGDGAICVLTADGWFLEHRLDESTQRYLKHIDFGGIVALSENEAWAVGSEGNILRFHDGEWRFDRMSGRLDGFFDMGRRQLRAIDVRKMRTGEPGWVWVAGDADTVYRRMLPVAENTTESTTTPTSEGTQVTATPGREVEWLLFIPLVALR